MELLAKLGINWQLLLAQIINFLILLAILTRFVYKPFLRLLDSRTERIRHAMAEAKKLEEEAVRMEAKRREHLKRMDEEAGRMLEEAKRQAETVQGELLAKARTEAERIVQQGKRKLEEERARALRELQGTAASLIVRLTETLLRREFTRNDQKKILDEVSQKIPSLLP